MNKRILSILLILLMSIGLFAGCKKNVGTSEDNAIKEEPEEDIEVETYHFGFSGITMENPYFITLEQSLREELDAAGHSLITKDPALNIDTQIAQIDEMIEEGIDALFLCPVEWNRITPALERLKASGVKIINIDSQVKEISFADAYVGSDNKNAGFICGTDLIEQCPDGGKIMILESPLQNSVNDRISGFEEAIADKGFEVVARADTQGDLNIAREAAEKVFEEHKDIVAVMCGNDQTALGALVSAHTSGLDNVKIYGVDGSPDLKKELLKKNSLIRGTSGQSPINLGKRAAKIGISMLRGEEFERESYEDVFFITSENVEMYGADGWQ